MSETDALELLEGLLEEVEQHFETYGRPAKSYDSHVSTNVEFEDRLEARTVGGDTVCPGTHGKGWSFDPATGFWNCGQCGKPSVYCSVFRCDHCDTIFRADKAPVNEFYICQSCDESLSDTGSELQSAGAATVNL